MKKTVSLILTSLLLVSCASLPPSVVERDPVVTIKIAENWTRPVSGNSIIVESLDSLFDDKSITELITAIKSNNLDIQLAYQQMTEFAYSVSGQESNFLPELVAKLGSSRARDASGETDTNYSIGADVSWEADIWGKISSQNQSLEAAFLSRKENLQAIQDSIVAQGIQAWFEMLTSEQLVKLSRQQLSNLGTRKAYISRRFQAGLDEYDDLVAIEREMAITESNLQDRIDLLNQSARQVQVLSGQYPKVIASKSNKLPTLSLPPKHGIPVNIITERPDIRSAWQDVLSADHSVNIAHKQLYPSISFSASISQQNSNASDLLDGSVLWSLASNLAFPIFNSGKLEAAMLEQYSRAEQAWINYLISVQTALSEVEQTLDREYLYYRKENSLLNALSLAEKTELITAKRYRTGIISILEYLNAQNTRFLVQSDLIIAKRDRLKNRVALALALGKGV